MKEQILEYLIGERDFDLGLILLTKYANNKALSNLIESCKKKGESEYNRNKLDYELMKLIGLPPHKVLKEQKMRNYEVIIIEERVLRSATIDSVEEVDKEERLLGSATTHSVEEIDSVEDLPKKK
jgi:hypothetical protein